MSQRLESSAEVLKLARLLDIEPSTLGFLESVPPTELRALREGVTDLIFDAGAKSLKRVAAGAKLLPSPLVATIALKSFGALLCARAAGAVDPDKALDVAKRLPAGFLADVTIQLDPRRVAAIISRVPEALVVPVATELGKREEHVTMGRFLAYVPDQAVVAAMTALSDEAMLRTAFVLEHKDRLDHALGLLPPARLPGIIESASALGLWPEALDLLEHLSDVRRGPVADVVADQSPEVIEGLVAAVSDAGIWENLLPVVRVMSETHRLQLAAHPAFHEEQILREIVTTAARSGLWIDLVPLLRVLPDEVFAQVPALVVELSNEALTSIVAEALESVEILAPFIDILSRMDEQGVQRVVDLIDGEHEELARLLVDALANRPELQDLLAQVPPHIHAAIETAAGRFGLRL
ncbi:MAG: hypothetical protein NTX33_12180 [Propionibacteriales bacterium]|nr:hypothetical protein [Propionibacteriales bacterium]